MESLRELRVDTYLGRLVVYAVVVGASSLVGSLFVRRYDHWVDPGLWAPIYIAAFSFGPLLAIVAAAKLSARATLVVAALAGAGILVLWWLFASNSSSTSVLAFAMGWWIGIPAATVIVVVADFRSRKQSDIGTQSHGHRPVPTAQDRPKPSTP